jgi:hypothetical protein
MGDSARRADRARADGLDEKMSHTETFPKTPPVDRRLTAVHTDEHRSAPERDRKSNIAVLVPCCNEGVTIRKVVREFRNAVPDAQVYVYDNASTDNTAAEAEAEGAIVRRVPDRGKGVVIRRMFGEVDADVYVIADGDGTYDASAAPELIARLREHRLDMVVGHRVAADETAARAYRRGHRLGNRILNRFVGSLFGTDPGDMLSGFRVLSRRYVRSFPAFSDGFEVETEMTVHALDLKLPFEEIPTSYCERPPNSSSKLRTIPDAFRIVMFLFALCKEYRPYRFFGALATMCALAAFAFRVWAGRPGIAVGLLACSALLALSAVVVASLARTRRETKRMLYLSCAATNQ